MTDLNFFNPLSKVKHLLTRQGTSTPTEDHAHADEQMVTASDSRPQTQTRTINVVLFGETGVGKSSVINLIARQSIAKVSSDVNGCTMQYQRYPIQFDNLDFAIFDTIGLEEPQMGVNGYLKAIEKAYDLISKLSTAGGIHLLLFCMRGGRITATTQSNYRLFCECLCNTKVPIALVFTGLEREVEMEDWWKRNRTHIEHYGIKSDGHACITAVPDDEGDDKYLKSQVTIRELLKTCARKGEAFSLESHSWFARVAGRMRGFVSAKKAPKDRDIMKVLTQRCKLDSDTAKRIAEMMKKGETEKGENNEVEDDGLAKDSMSADSPPSEPDNPKGVSGDVANEIEVVDRSKTVYTPLPEPTNGGKGVTRKNATDGALPRERNNVGLSSDAVPNGGKSAAPAVPNEGKGVTRKNVTDGALPQERNNIELSSDAVPNGGKSAAPAVPNGGKGVTRKNATDGALPQERDNVELSSDAVPNGGKSVGKTNVAKDPPLQAPGNAEVVSGTVASGGKNAVQDDPPQESSKVTGAPDLGKETAKKNVSNVASPQEPAAPDTALSARKELTKNAAQDVSLGSVANRGKEATTRNVARDPPPQQPSSVGVVPPARGIVAGKEITKKNGTANIPLQEPSKAAPGAVPNGSHDVAEKNVVHSSYPKAGRFKAVPSDGKGGNHGGKSRRESDGSSVVERAKRNTLKKQGDPISSGYVDVVSPR